MSLHRVQLAWSREARPFAREQFPRDHRVRFEGGQEIGASSAVDYGGNPDLADPEQLLIAALSSCHMLTFLAVVANRGYVLESYEDQAEGTLGTDEQGRTAVTAVTLRPRARFDAAKVPSADDLARFHERAHRACFIANSIRARVDVAPRD